MMHINRSCLLFVFFYLRLLVVSAQEFGYTRYDTKDGLAGSTVYCMTQDKDGFLWFGTESGLSRFDGTHFKNFTKADGLPDNEIIQVFADSKGRVWISPFKKTVCYYYKGKIYNRNNDSLLAGLRIADHVIRFAEDDGGNILMQENTRLLHLKPSTGPAMSIDNYGKEPIGYITTIARSATGKFWVANENRIFEYSHNKFTEFKSLDCTPVLFTPAALSVKGILTYCTSGRIMVRSFEKDDISFYPIPQMPVNLSLLSDNRFGICTRSGAIVCNFNKPDSTAIFLKGIPVSNIMEDNEGNLWFCTSGQGVYRLNSTVVFNLKLKNENNRPLQVRSFTKYKQSILAGTDMGTLCMLSAETGKPEKTFSSIIEEKEPIIDICILKNNECIFGTRRGLYRLSSDFKLLKQTKFAIKALYYDNDKLFMTTHMGTFVVDQGNLATPDTIWRERTTTLFARNDTVYIGTLSGLNIVFPDRTIQRPAEKTPELHTRISCIRKDNQGVLWIGTYSDGLIAWKNGRIIARIQQQNGLSGNMCRTIFLNDRTLWVGTDKGLNRINISDPGFPVRKFTTGDGLASDIINAVYVEKGKVFIGTSEGITFFDEQKVVSPSRCDLRFTDIAVGGDIWYGNEMPAIIPHKKNNIRFNYVGISYKSAGDIRYRYRLLGLDSTWKETRETFLSYPTLPSGEYELQLQAINKFDVYSKLVASKFSIQKLLWEETWFQLLAGLIFLTLTTLLVLLITRRIRNREREKLIISKRIGDLEQLARKAQMNPHFIFNSLNSIQQYVMDSDIVGANKFISGFSRLIRQTLDFSSKPEISLAEELDYLTNYLELEKTRLENAFSWSVSVSPDVNTSDYFIPPMILQPFVENSVRHGLRYRKDKEGKVAVTIKKENDFLICVLEDNGVGRKTALKYKSANPIEYQSKGMSLTAERITMLNKDNPYKITMQIDDLEDHRQNPLGTRVTLSFPV